MAAPTKHVLQASTARAHATIRVATATSATAAFPIARQVSIGVAVAALAMGHARRARISLTTRHTLARALSIRTTVDGAATEHTSTVATNAPAAPTSLAARISTARAHAITRVAMGTSAIAVQPTVPLGTIAAAVAVQIQDTAFFARTSLRMPHTRARAPSM